MPKDPRKKKGRPAGDAGAPAEGGISNLEMAGDRLKIYSLQNLLTNKRSPETRDVARLGDVLLPWFEKAVSKPGEKLEGVLELWQRLVPGALLGRSRLLGLHRGTLNVALDSATVRAEVDGLLRGGLLRELQKESRGVVYRVKTSVQGLRREAS
ncbi:MAG TPA: DciA family protein [Phycisphaerae bacterium]|nr:DciA family protein [Phycisphaerae bacterium]